MVVLINGNYNVNFHRERKPEQEISLKKIYDEGKKMISRLKKCTMGLKHLYFIKFMYNIIKVENFASDNVFFRRNFLRGGR